MRACVGLIVLVLAGFALAACGGDSEPATENAAQVTIAQVLRDPDAFDQRPVLVRGEAHRLSDLGFFLTAEGRSIFVGAPASELAQLEEGEAVRVRGDLEQLSETRAETIRDALNATPEDVEGPPAPVFERAVGPDKPFLNLRVLYGAEG